MGWQYGGHATKGFGKGSAIAASHVARPGVPRILSRANDHLIVRSRSKSRSPWHSYEDQAAIWDGLQGPTPVATNACGRLSSENVQMVWG